MKAVEIASVCYVAIICTVNSIFSYVLLWSILSLLFNVEKFPCGYRPCKQVAILVKRSKKTIFLSPNNVFVLAAHADAGQQVQVRQRNHWNRVVILNERKSVRKKTVVNYVAKSSYRWCNLIFLNFSLKQRLKIVSVKATRTHPTIWLWLDLAILVFIADSNRLIDWVADRV